MELAALAILGTGGIASAAAIVAVAINRLRKVAAGIFALAGGIVPWLFLAMMKGWIPSSSLLSVVGIFGGGPLFLVAFFLYGLGERTPRRGFAAGASLVGMFAGIGFSVFVFGGLARME